MPMSLGEVKVAVKVLNISWLETTAFTLLWFLKWGQRCSEASEVPQFWPKMTLNSRRISLQI